jgi:Family of unknown function (DUF6056)
VSRIEGPLPAGTRGVDEQLARRAIWLPIGMLGCFVILLFCAIPHSDDLCFAAGWRDQGLVKMLAYLYQNIQGRLVAPPLVVIPFMAHYVLGGDLLIIFRIFCATALAATVGVALFASRVLLPGFPSSLRLLTGLLLAVVLVAGSPQPEDIFYWANGIGNYTFAAVFLLWAMFWLYRRADQKARLGGPAVATLMAGGLMVAMTTEISGPELLVIVLASMLQRRLVPGTPRQPLAHVLILGATAIGVAIVVLAPGNAGRMHQMGSDHDLAWRAMMGGPMGIAYTGQFLFRRLTNPAMIAWLAFLVLAVPARLDGAASPARPAWLVWLPLAAAMIAIYGSLYIGYVATADVLPPRALDQLHFILVGGLSLTAVMASPAVGARVWREIEARWPTLDRRKLAIAALILALATPNFVQAVRTLPHVVPLYRLEQARFAIFGSGKAIGAPIADRELLVPPSSTSNTAWFSDPVSSVADDWVNGCVAQFVGVRWVRIAPSPSD